MCNPMDFMALLNINTGIKIQATKGKDFFFGEELEISAALKKALYCVSGFLIYLLSPQSSLNAPCPFL